MDRMNRPTFWVLYDYGQGGLWAIILADSAEQIRARYPELQVFDTPPPTLDATVIETIRQQGARSVEDPPTGWMADLQQAGTGGVPPSAG